MSEGRTVVIDHGSHKIRAGLSGDNSPWELPTVVAYSHNRTKHYICGSDWPPHELEYSYPIERGLVTNWDEMELIWYYVFNKLFPFPIDPTEQAVLLTEPPLNPKANREKMAQVMFETFKTPVLFIAIQAVMALYAAGRTTGIVLDSGYGVTHAVPIYEGHYFPHATIRLDLGGRDLSDYLTRMLNERGTNSFGSSFDDQYKVNCIKETCQVALHYDEEVKRATDFTVSPWQLDDQNFVIGNECYRCPEALFQPQLLGMESIGIHEAIYKSIKKCDAQIHKELFGNIILTGGSTQFSGMVERLEHEMSILAPEARTKIGGPPGRVNQAWLGGNILGSLSTFQDIWITKEEYEESGSVIVNRKCF